MDAKTISQVEQLYGHYARSNESGERRKLFAALSDCLTVHFTIDARLLRSKSFVQIDEVRAHYASARLFSDLRMLDVGACAFDEKLEALCRELGAVRGNGPELLRAA